MLGHWYDSAYNIEIKEGVEPYHAKPYPVPRIHKATLKWTKRSHVLLPLTSLTSKTAKWHWGDVEQTAFNTIKKIVAK